MGGLLIFLCLQTVELRTVILKVVMHCEGCAGSVKRAVKRIPGKLLGHSILVLLLLLLLLLDLMMIIIIILSIN
jgi:hypothetical protein